MLRYKKHKRQADGLGTSVALMDDTDREVSSFTDRAFRSLCIAEEELFNDVPHLPSPIRGMPLSTKYHLGIFNLSVRKTQPLAQLPTTPRQRGKWAPTFQPLLNYAKVGTTDVKTNNNKLCAPVPRGYKQRSKVSSLIRTFDNIENEIPDDSTVHTRLPFSKSSQMDMVESPVGEIVEKNAVSSEPLAESINQDESLLNENQNLHRRTAREVFLESQTEMSSRVSRSPSHSPGSPTVDQVKKVVRQRDSLRRTAFLHSEHSAFKSWSDINKRTMGGDESDSSIPGTPPIPRSATPCSPLLQRAMPGIKARDGGIELGWTSPASSVSSSYDPIQMLRTVPPLPIRKTRQNRDSSNKTIRTPLNTRSHDGSKADEGPSSTKEHGNWTNKENTPKTPEQHKALPDHGAVLSNAPQCLAKVNEEDRAKIASAQQIEMSEAPIKEEVKEPEKDKPPPGRIKTLIQQLEKETIKDMASGLLTDKKPGITETPKDEAIDVTTSNAKSPPISNTIPSSKDHVPPWRKTKSSNKIVPEKKIVVAQFQENITLNKDDVPEEKPSPFNISNLLTPVIRRKNIQEALDEHIVMTPAVTNTAKDQDQKETNLYQKRDDYKSKATSLLFNLKDMRKRVKSTYNPAITTKNGYENNLITDVKLPDVNKSVYETDNSNQSNFEENVRSPRESEIKSNLAGNESENYLSLSPMDQITTLQNGEIPKEKGLSDTNVMHEEQVTSVNLITNDNHIKKDTDYPSLNLYSKADNYVSSKHTEYTQESLACLENREVHSLPKREHVREEIKYNEFVDVANSSVCVLETSMETVPQQSKQNVPHQEVESEWVVEHNESEKQVVKDNEAPDILQYFAVNSSNGVEAEMDSNEKSNVLESQIEIKESEQKLTDEEPVCLEELRRPSSITPLRPSLFCLKDNKIIKSSPVTKSVRPRLFRSLSEDCLVFKKFEDNNFSLRIGDLRETGESKGISTDILSTNTFEISNMSKHQKHLIVSPTSKTQKQEAIEYNQIKSQKEEEGDQALLDAINVTKSSRIKSPPCLEESFFHPVETCVSEVAGPSPECNTLIVHNVSELMKEQVNGEHGSPCVNAENYSPIDGLLQFEDSVSFIEDIACSTITSPMSESVTCSIVASPMSVNTQSSGFTTALSALEDIPSPPATSANTRNGKLNSFLPERVIRTDSDPKNIDFTKPEKATVLESQRVDAKPPAVPPKTEKALRRAKRLTKKRRKTEVPQRVQEEDFEGSDIVLDVSSPGNVTPTLVTLPSHHKLISCRSRTLDHEDTISEPSTASLPLTQRKLLQDPDSGQYFMVDIPLCLRIKTFYDPETGKYLQMSLPRSEMGSPAFEMSNSPYTMYSGLTPVPVSSIASYKGASQLLNHDNVSDCEREVLWNEDSLKMHNLIHCDSQSQRMTGTPLSIDRFTSRSSDIISMKDIDDFAMEAVS